MIGVDIADIRREGARVPFRRAGDDEVDVRKEPPLDLGIVGRIPVRTENRARHPSKYMDVSNGPPA